MPRPPNILWICTDQQRADTIAALGNRNIRTPHVDSLVGSGTSFTNVFCQSPVCTPSRASMLTGRYPRTTRCRQNGQQIPASERLVPRILADAGYTCGLSGKLHLSSCAAGRVEQRIDDGYSEFYWSHHPQPDWPENAYTQWLERHGQSWDKLYSGKQGGWVKEGVPACWHQTTWCAEMAVDFMRRHRHEPWMFSVNFYDPHHPFDPPAEYLERYDPGDMPLPKYRPGELDGKPRYQQLDHERSHNEPHGMQFDALSPRQLQEITAAYYAMIELIDDQVGRMLAALDATGQRENTVVLFMSDHGELLGDHGMFLKGPHFYEASVRVPLVISAPGTVSPGLRSSALVELTDLAPTLLELAGLEPEPQMQGRSLLPIAAGHADPTQHRPFVYSEYYNAWTHHRAYGTMLRTTSEKIVVYHGAPEGTVDGELYDLAADPDEQFNRWNDRDYADRKIALLKQAFDASVLTMDPTPPRLGAF